VETAPNLAFSATASFKPTNGLLCPKNMLAMRLRLWSVMIYSYYCSDKRQINWLNC